MKRTDLIDEMLKVCHEDRLHYQNPRRAQELLILAAIEIGGRKTGKLVTALKWIGTGAQVAGVFALAGQALQPAAAFAVMLVGSLAWSIAAWRVRDWALITLYAAFTTSNLIGLWRWWPV